MTKREITDRLFEMQDQKYRDFNSSLIPGVKKDLVIGVRTPLLRRFAKELGREDTELFLSSLPHRYLEENTLHGFLISEIRDYDRCISELDRFLPYVDNWSTCDGILPKAFKKNTYRLIIKIREWVASKDTYTVRFAIGMLMRHYLDDDFKTEYSDIVSFVKSNEYYINMMRAWYFATALAKQYDAVLPYIKEKRLDRWTHNKTIQKAVESYRITDEQKAELRALRIK